MPTLNIEGMGSVQVGDEFLKLSPEQQHSTVDEISSSLKQKQSQSQEPVRARDLFGRELIGQGAMAGFGDEAEAAARATYAKVQGDPTPWSDLYTQHLQNARTMLKRFEQKAEQQDPGLATEAQIVGAVGGLAIPGPDIIEGGTLLARAANTALKGAGYGAVSGFGTGQGAENRLAQAGVGAALGGATGAVAAPVAELAGRAASGLVQPIAAAINPEAVASSRVGRALIQDVGKGLSPSEFSAARRAGVPVTNLEMGGEATRALMRSAANTSPVARQTIEDVVQPRFSEQGDRIRTYLDNIVGRQNTATSREALIQAAEKQNAPAYAKAYGDPAAQSVWSPQLQELTAAPAVQSAIRRATSTGANKAAAAGFPATRNPFAVDPATGRLTLKPGATPTLQFWDYVKRNLDDQFSALSRAGKKSAASDVLALKKGLVNLLDETVPAYQAARSGAASFFGAQDALSAGENFVGLKGNIVDAEAAFNKMKPAEKELFKVGFASKLMDAISKMPDRADVVRKIFGSSDARERMTLALGTRGANQMEALLAVEGLMDESRKALGNSTTARQLAELGAAGGVSGLGGLGFGLLSGDRSLKGLSGDFSVAAILGASAKRAGIKIDERVVESVAKQLVSSNPRVYQAAISKVAKNPTLLKLLKTAASIPIAPAVQAGQMPQR